MTTPARILVADDDPLFRRLVVRMLELEGYVVEHTSNATDALARLSTTLFELLVADVNMPGNDGLAVLRDQSAVPVLIVTGDPSVESAVAALRGSAVDYLAKPMAPEEFLARVAAGVARARALQVLRGAEDRLSAQIDLVRGLRESLTAAGGSVRVAAGGASLDSVATPLTPREREVLRAFRVTPRASEVAVSLSISPHTVKNHLKAIYRKLEVSSQAELLAKLMGSPD